MKRAHTTRGSGRKGLNSSGSTVRLEADADAKAGAAALIMKRIYDSTNQKETGNNRSFRVHIWLDSWALAAACVLLTPGEREMKE